MTTIQRTRARAVRRRLLRPGRPGLLAGVVVAIGLLAGCGGGSSGSAGGGGSPSSKQNGAGQLVRYAQCMREHGVTSFPDPTSGGQISLDKTTAAAPRFQTASQACRSLLPGGSQNSRSVTPWQKAQALRFAGCMRAHGVPNFPDPSFAGGLLGISISPNVSNSPSYMTAQQYCRSHIRGGGGFPPIGGSHS